MIENDDTPVRNISAEITEKQKEAILNYLHGMVHLWCKIQGTKRFYARDLLGVNTDNDGNYYWNGTPLYCLYKYYNDKNYDDPINMAGRDAGHLLKSVIKDIEKRTFHTGKDGSSFARRWYEWIGDEV